MTRIIKVRIITRIKVNNIVEGVYGVKSFSSKEIIRQIKVDGWYLVNGVGSHQQYKHPIKPGKVTVPHPKKDVTKKTVKRIEKQAGIILK